MSSTSPPSLAFSPNGLCLAIGTCQQPADLAYAPQNAMRAPHCGVRIMFAGPPMVCLPAAAREASSAALASRQVTHLALCSVMPLCEPSVWCSQNHARHL